MAFYEDLPDGDKEAFLHLEAGFRSEFTLRTESGSNSFDLYAHEYMHQVSSAAEAFDVPEVSSIRIVSFRSDDFDECFTEFKAAVDRVRVRYSIQLSRSAKASGVGLDAEQRQKIHKYLTKIREAVDQSEATVAKKERIFAILAKLALEVDRPRTLMDKFGDLARELSGISHTLSDGAEPWFKWFKATMGILDDAKEGELMLPRPQEQKKLPPPRSAPDKARDDDIPF